eukprot:gene34942-57805_t
MHANLIAGTWTEGVRTYRNTNPSDTRDVIGDYAVASREQALDAVAAAHAAFPAWSLSTPQQRFDILDAVGNEIIARKAELGDLLAVLDASGAYIPSGQVPELTRFVVSAENRLYLIAPDERRFWNLDDPSKPWGLMDPDDVLNVPYDFSEWLADQGTAYASHNLVVADGLQAITVSPDSGVITVQVQRAPA